MNTTRSIIKLASLALLLTSSVAFADQLAWNEQVISERGARAIQPDSFLVTYCSLCDHEQVEVWLVRKVVVSAVETQGLYEVSIFGRRLLRSVKSFDAGDYMEPVKYRAAPPDEQSGWFLEGIDLAYVYIPSGGNSFRCLGKVLELECDVKVESITLPAEAMTNAMKQRNASRPSDRTK